MIENDIKNLLVLVNVKGRHVFFFLFGKKEIILLSKDLNIVLVVESEDYWNFLVIKSVKNWVIKIIVEENMMFIIDNEVVIFNVMEHNVLEITLVDEKDLNSIVL